MQPNFLLLFRSNIPPNLPELSNPDISRLRKFFLLYKIEYSFLWILDSIQAMTRGNFLYLAI